MYADMNDGGESQSDDEIDEAKPGDEVAESESASKPSAEPTGESSADHEDGTPAPTLDDDDSTEKDEFKLEKEEVDDETTMETEEKLGRDMSYADEIDLLNRENEMSVDELRAMYANMDENKTGSECARDEPSEMDVDDDSDRDVPAKSDRKRRGADDGDDTDDSGDGPGPSSAKRPKRDGGDEGISALEKLAASDTRARETMITRPFLLAGWVKLRAYQQIGLNWLVSVQTRYVQVFSFQRQSFVCFLHSARLI